MSLDLHVRQVVQAGPPQRPVGHVEAGRLDDVHDHAEAGCQAQDRTRILRNIRLI